MNYFDIDDDDDDDDDGFDDDDDSSVEVNYDDDDDVGDRIFGPFSRDNDYNIKSA